MMQQMEPIVWCCSHGHITESQVSKVQYLVIKLMFNASHVARAALRGRVLGLVLLALMKIRAYGSKALR